MKIRYKGPANVIRQVTKGQFEARGVSNQDTIEINPQHDAARVVQVSEEAAQLLLTAEPQEWEEAEPLKKKQEEEPQAVAAPPQQDQAEPEAPAPTKKPR